MQALRALLFRPYRSGTPEVEARFGERSVS